VSECDEDSYACSIAPPDHWDLVDCIAIVSQSHKSVGSTEGHALAHTSPIQAARVADAPRRLDLCRKAILERDFDALASMIELDRQPDARRYDDLLTASLLLAASQCGNYAPGS